MQLEEKLHENVYYYTDVIKNPQNIIEKIEALDLNSTSYPAIPKWIDWDSNSKDGSIFGQRKDFRLEEVSNLSGDVRLDADYIITEIKEAIKNVANAFIKDRGLSKTPNLSPFVGISKYNPGCAMGPHYDRQGGDNSLEYSMIIYWNDNYEGGEISFIIRDEDLALPENSHLKLLDDAQHWKTKKLANFTLKPKAGSALIFPSTDPYKHQVHTIKSGDKYISPGFIFVDGYKAHQPNNI